MTVTREIDLGGRTLQVETGRVALQANGAVTVRMGDTLVLATATMSDEDREEHAEQGHQQADYRKAAGKHWYLLDRLENARFRLNGL